MATFNGRLDPKVVDEYPYPTNLGTAIMHDLGYVFAGVPEEFQQSDDNVPIYNLDVLVGYITYTRNDNGTVDVFIEDVENPRGEVLTYAAQRAVEKQSQVTIE